MANINIGGIKVMKKLFALGSAALLALGLVSCGPSEGTTPTPGPVIPGGNNGGGEETPDTPKDEGKTIYLEYSGTASDKEFNLGLFEDFKAARAAAGDKNTYVISYVEHGPDAVDSEVIDWTTGPDVYEFASDKITGLYQKGALAKLSPVQSSWVKTNNSQLGYDLATFNGSVYAYPYTGDNTYYLQYDTSKFTAEEVKSVESILAKCEENGWLFGYNLETAYWGGGALFTYGADYSISFDVDGSVNSIAANFDGEAGQKAIKAMTKIMSSKAWSNTMEAPTPSNSYAACIAGTWEIGAYKEALGEDYGCAVMPTVTVDDDTKNLGAFLGGKLLGVNPNRAGSDQDRLKAAHELAKFLSDYDCQMKRFQANNVAPCNVDAAAEESVLASPNVKVLVEHAKYAHAQTAVPDNYWNAPATLVASIKETLAAAGTFDYPALATNLNNSIKGE
jgi:arabinogalactan oligomer/maltooligosaccharide transport system substrate-binding protein